jgi:hypothetical protein
MHIKGTMKLYKSPDFAIKGASHAMLYLHQTVAAPLMRKEEDKREEPENTGGRGKPQVRPLCGTTHRTANGPARLSATETGTPIASVRQGARLQVWQEAAQEPQVGHKFDPNFQGMIRTASSP